MSRHSITRALASARGTRTLISNARLRYGRNDWLVHVLESALEDVNRAELKLRRALGGAMAFTKRRRAA